MEEQIINGFSKLTANEKMKLVANFTTAPAIFIQEMQRHLNLDRDLQAKYLEFSENTLSNYYLPYGVAPNFVINGNVYMVPMVTEESSVIAAAADAAKWWAKNGGFTATVKSLKKMGHVHFLYKGNKQRLIEDFDGIKKELFICVSHITANMMKRGGGIKQIHLIDKTDIIPDYFQLEVIFDTRNSMGANFINTVLEEMASKLKLLFDKCFEEEESANVNVIMSILSNYTPECLVEVSVGCEIYKFESFYRGGSHNFADRFKMAVDIANNDMYRAVTHNKGIFNGIDAVVMATGNDYRAIEACGHAYAANSGKYSGLTKVKLEGKQFTYTLTLPLSLGTVGGLTRIHPLAKQSLELLGNPDAEKLMQIAASVGLANNFNAIKSLVTSGIQKGHMKMHLNNMLAELNANEFEKQKARADFKNETVTYSGLRNYLDAIRDKNLLKKK